jgi:hypothetical protein
MGGVFDGLTFIYGFLFAAILVIKYMKDRQLNRTALTMLVGGLASLVVGGFLGLMVSLGSARGAQIVLALFATGSGVLLVLGLFVELLGGMQKGAVLQVPPRQAASGGEPPAHG